LFAEKREMSQREPSTRNFDGTEPQINADGRRWTQVDMDGNTGHFQTDPRSSAIPSPLSSCLRDFVFQCRNFAWRVPSGTFRASQRKNVESRAEPGDEEVSEAPVRRR